MGGGGKVQNIGGGQGGGGGSPNQCQIITFLTLKSDNVAKLRIELKSIRLEILQIKQKVHILNGYICDLVFTVSHRH